MKRILLTNDDGIDADGLASLARHLRLLPEIGSVYVVAPMDGRSCCGHSINTYSPIRIDQRSEFDFAVDGWPADCVRIGLIHLRLDIDLVISGVNHGGNLGTDIVASGTCSAAREAAWLGKKSIAISQYRNPIVDSDWDVTASRAAEIIAMMKVPDRWHLRGFWNVNLPAISSDQKMGIPVECQPEAQPHRFFYETTTEESVIYRSNYQNRARSPGSDVDVCFNGSPSLTFCPC